MADLTKGRTEEPPEPASQKGFVTTAPATLEDSFTVTVPGFSTDHFFEIHRWMHRGTLMPAVGDEVLVLLDDKGEPWVPAWWSAEGDPESEGPDTLDILSLVVSSILPLAKEADWVSAWVPASFWHARIIGSVFADHDGTLHIEQSADGVNVDVDTSYEIKAGDGKGFDEDRVAKFWRLRYVNGAVAQAVFRIAGEVRGG